MDEEPAADVHAFVAGDPEGAGVEEDEVAGLQRLRGHGRALVELSPRVVREGDPELRVDEHRQAGAIEAGERARAAPAIRNPQVLGCDRDRAAADPVRGRQDAVEKRFRHDR